MIDTTCIYVCSSFRPDTAAVATRSAGLVAALQQRFARVIVLSAGPTRQVVGVRVTGLGLATPSNTLPVPLRLLQEISFAAWAGARLLLLIPAHSAMGRPVVVLSTPPLWLALAGAAAARVRGAAIAVDVRDRYPDVFFAMGLLRRNSRLGRLLLQAEAWLYRQAVLTTTVTKAIAAGIAADHGGQPVELVRNGFDPQLFQPDLALQPPASSGQPLRLIMHGMFGRFFDYDAFVALLQGIRSRKLPVQLIVVGHGPQMPAIAALACEQLRLQPPVPQAEVARLIAGCHVGLAMGIDNASMRGTFPTKLFEAIGCGLPVLVFPRSEAGLELASQGMGWTFSPGEINHALKIIEELCKNIDLWQQMRNSVLAKKASYVRFDQANQFAKLLERSVKNPSWLSEVG